MSFKVRYFGALLVFGFGVVQGSAPERIGAYDFSYECTGDYRVKPVQVFDNGTYTYFQFRAGEPIPAIFAQGPTGATFQTPEMDGPYTRVSGVARTYALRLGRGQGNVVYAGLAPSSVAKPAQPAQANGQFATVVQPGSVLPEYRPVPRPRASMDRLLAAVGGIETLPRSVLEEQPQPRIAVDVNSYAVPVQGDVAQFQPTGVSPTVSAGPVYTGGSQAAANRAVGQNSVSGSYGSVPARINEANIQFAIGSTKLGAKGSESVRAVARTRAPTARYEVIGRYDASYKDGVAQSRANSVAAQLVSAGVPRALITVMTTESLIPLPQAGITTGATVTVREAGAVAGTQAFIDTAQVTDANLSALAATLSARRMSAAQAAKEVEAVRNATSAHFVQPISGFQEAQISRWQMRAMDVNVRGVLQRWANEAGWQLIWKNGPEIKVSGNAELVRDGFVSATDYVISQARSYGHRIRAHAYNNKVMVVTAE